MSWTIWTDGSCLKNSSEGGPSGIGYVVLHNGLEYQYSLGYYRSTNNRAEMLAVILPLEELQVPSEIEICTDSEYTINAVTKWFYKWARNHWLTSAKKKEVANKDLILRIRALMQYHDIKFTKVPAHSGLYYNELCDRLAKAGARNPTMVDMGFIRRKNHG